MHGGASSVPMPSQSVPGPSGHHLGRGFGLSQHPGKQTHGCQVSVWGMPPRCVLKAPTRAFPRGDPFWAAFQRLVTSIWVYPIQAGPRGARRGGGGGGAGGGLAHTGKTSAATGSRTTRWVCPSFSSPGNSVRTLAGSGGVLSRRKDIHNGGRIIWPCGCGHEHDGDFDRLVHGSYPGAAPAARDRPAIAAHRSAGTKPPRARL
jgi:hypothetical protein